MAKRGRGTKFSRDNGASYDEILDVTNIGGIGVSKGTIDTTALNPTDGFRTFIGAVKEGKPVTIGGNLDPDLTTADAKKQGLLKSDVEGDADTVSYRIEFVNGATVTFDAVATDFDVSDVVVDGKLEWSFTCQPSGKPVWVDAP